MKRLLIILLVLCSVISFSQSVVNRAGPSNTVSDARLQAQYNLFIPRVLDTTAALTPPARGLDTCGAIIYTYADDAFWYRACYPYKHWARVGSGSSLPQLPDGLYSGGDVAWTGTGLTFSVTPAIYVLNGTPYAFNGGNITLPAADPTFDKIVVIILDSSGASYVDGIPSATPQEPSINPQTQIRRAIVTVPANSPIPAIVTQILYDENLGTPTEWDATSTGTVVFGNTNFPFHLTIAAAASGFVAGQYIGLNYTDTVNSLPRGNLVAFLRLAGVMQPSQNFNVNLLYQGNIVGQTLNFTIGGMSNGLLNSYQALVFPMTSFSPGNLIFDEVRFTAVGIGTFPAFNLDYIQFQTGIIPVTVIPNQKFGHPQGDNFGNESRLFDQNDFNFSLINGNVGIRSIAPSKALSIGNDINNAEALTLYAPDGSSSFISGADGTSLTIKSGINTRLIPTLNGGFLSYESNVIGAESGVYARYFNANNAELGRIGEGELIANVSRELFLKPMSTGGKSTYLNLYGPIKMTDLPGLTTADTLIAQKGDSLVKIPYSALSATYFNANIGAGFRLAVPGTNNIKTLFSNVTGAWDSASNANALTFKVDTTVIATRAYANNLVTTYFNSNVGSSYRWAIPGTNNIKTLRVLNGILADSVTANTLSIQVDSATYATKAFVASVAGGGGFTGVTSVSVVNANGFNGSVATATTTPAITISTTITGVLKGNGTAISAATVGTDYSVGTSALATGLLKSTTATGALSIAVANTDYVTPAVTTLSSLVSVGTMTTGSISTGFIVRGVTMTLGSDASFDSYYRNASGILTRLANGTTGQVYTATTGAAPSWQTVAASLTINSSLINSGTSGRILFQNASNQVSQSANLFFDATNNRIQSRVFLNAGTAAANTAPLKFTTGTVLTTPEAGAMEYDATNFYLSPSTTRKRIPLTNNATPANGQIGIGNGVDYTVANITAAANNLVITNGAGTISVGANGAFQTLTTGATITWNAALGYNANLTLANTGATLNITNPVDGQEYALIITQGTGGSRTITTWPAGTIWPNGTPPTLSTTLGAVNVITLKRRGTGYIGKYDSSPYQ